MVILGKPEGQIRVRIWPYVWQPIIQACISSHIWWGSQHVWPSGLMQNFISSRFETWIFCSKSKNKTKPTDAFLLLQPSSCLLEPTYTVAAFLLNAGFHIAHDECWLSAWCGSSKKCRQEHTHANTHTRSGLQAFQVPDSFLESLALSCQQHPPLQSTWFFQKHIFARFKSGHHELNTHPCFLPPKTIITIFLNVSNTYYY